MIAIDILDTDEASDYGSIDNDVAALNEEGESHAREADVITGVTESRTKEVEEVHQAMKSSYIFPLC